MVMNLYSALIYSNAFYKQVIYGPQHRELRALLFTMSVGFLTSPASHYSEDAGDGAYGLSSLSEKTLLTESVILRPWSVGPVWGSNPRPPAR